MSNSIKLANAIFPPESVDRIESINYIYQKRVKIVVFTPGDIADKLTSAMASAGAGSIGNYTECSFRAEGTGTFRGGRNTNPHIGTKGNFEKVEELRLEMICMHDDIDTVIDAVLRVHPYEEPAFEIYDVLVRQQIKNSDAVKITLKRPVDLKTILNKINIELETLDLPEELAGLRIQKAVINFSGKELSSAFVPDDIRPALYLTGKRNKSYIISLK